MPHLNPTGKKRRRGWKVFGFRNFCEPGNPSEFNGHFRDNLKQLLEFAPMETNLCGGMRRWSFQLELHNGNPPYRVTLFVIEEAMESSNCCRCDHCQFAGWGHHMICNERFHFVLPSKETAALVMTMCSNSKGKATSFEELHDQGDGHLLHGVLHSNGFGHLICVNGIERGSELPGNQIMEFWDRICTKLRARKVSVNDVSTKQTMELRLIHGVAFGQPWFSRWGYRLRRGNYGVTQQMYQRAVEGIQTMPLSILIQHFKTISDNQILYIFNRYQTMASNSLLSVGHLFCFMHELRSRLPLEAPMSSINAKPVVETPCRWSPKRIEMATKVVVESLRKADFRWVSRQELRDVARAYIGDTGLLDFVLKSLGNHVVGKYLIRRTVNPVTKVLEYCLEDISNTFCNEEGFSPSNTSTRYQITKDQIMNDMFYLYTCLFLVPRPTALTTGIFSAISMATRIILDAKSLIKDYRGESYGKFDVGDEESLKLLCTVSLTNDDQGINKTLPPCIVITLPPHATFRELKLEVQRSFRETYWGLKSFVAESVVDVHAKESDLVFGVVEAGCTLVVTGRVEDREVDVQEIYAARKCDNLVVNCPCGAKEDDGEKLITCDICEVRQHNRCAQMSNSTEDVPHIFLCSRCEQEIVNFPSL